ncbi:SDR family oxidoreductase [Paenibacillus sp. DMB20]|uniref:SDR family oxidoreductase n=1 Tax=Paenibacillus sp. DMB20 TaxID=1642570 RepID=UPI00069C13D7|nr:SDR family oxidoreductase [Paenibacillus sp. DMB20]
MKVIITGGSRGIGHAIARQLSLAGHELLLVGRNGERLAKAKASLPVKTLVYPVDHTIDGAPDELIAYMKEQGFDPDVLILNAAAFFDETRSVIKPDGQDFERMLQANVVANYNWVQKLLPLIRGGMYPRIIVIGSTAALRADTSLYGISKAAMRNYTLGLREELKPTGVGVTLIHPGGTFTEKRVPDEQTASDRLLEAGDIGLLVAAILSLSPQAVVEELTVRPMLGDTF